MKHRIYIQGMEFKSLNELYRMHWTQRARYVNELKSYSHLLWNATGAERMEPPVEFEFQHLSPKGKLFDADNYVSITKPIMDAASVAGIIEDDGPAWVKRVILNTGRRPVGKELEIVHRPILIAEVRNG